MDRYQTMDLILSTEDVTTGGGSASAISAAMAAGLIGMVARLSTKKDYGLSAGEHLAVAEACDKLSEELMNGALEDRSAYAQIKEAFGLPKRTDDEKIARNRAINDAGYHGAMIPYSNAEKSMDVLDLGRKIRLVSNPSANSDLQIGIHLAEIGVKGCMMNIEANLPLIKDPVMLEELKKKTILLNGRL